MPHLVDTTLRDGEQCPGLEFRPEQRVEIACALDAAGIGELELAVAARVGPQWREPEALKERGVRARLTSWCRLREDDVATALSTAVDCVHVAVPGSEPHLGVVGLSRAQALERLRACVARILMEDRVASVGVVDASRCSVGWLEELAGVSEAEGAQRVRLADTVGIWNPFAVYDAFHRVGLAAPELVLGCHAHNDLGMAVANSLAALRAGAQTLDGTVLGLGERAGNAALEQLVVAAHVSQGVDLGVRMQALPELCALVARCAGRVIAVDTPVVGANAFLHTSGIHVHGLLRDRTTFEPYAPELCGRTSRLAVDSHSGRTARRVLGDGKETLR